MRLEPLSIIAAILSISALIARGMIANFLLLIAAILVFLSYKRFKKNSKYKIRWPLHASSVTILAVLLIKIALFIINLTL